MTPRSTIIYIMKKRYLDNQDLAPTVDTEPKVFDTYEKASTMLALTNVT